MDDSPSLPGRKHSASFRAITARQLQALGRPLASGIDELLQCKANVAGDLSEQCGRDVSALVNRNCGDATVSVTELFV